MIELNKRYKTRCGYPVRNLHWDMLAIDGEYYCEEKWYLGSWLYDGSPAIFTTNKEMISSLSLVELTKVSMIIVQDQLELNFNDLS